MARKPQQSSLFRRQLTGDQWFNFYRRELRGIVHSMFEWHGLPETINPKFLERTLHTDGVICFYDDPRFGVMAIKGTPQYLNAYGEPTDFHASMHMYHKSIKLYNYLIPIEVAKERNLGVICENQMDGIISSEQAIFLYSAMLAENKQTKIISQNTLKVPYVFKGTPEQVLSVKNIFEKIQANEPLLIEEEEQDLLGKLEILNTNAPFILDKLQTDRAEIYNEFLTGFGINNVDIQKKERLVKSEADSNNELIMHNRNKFLAPRQEAARILSEIFEREITVDIRSNLESIVVSKGSEING